MTFYSANNRGCGCGLFSFLWLASWILQFCAIVSGIKVGFGAHGLAATILAFVVAFFIAGVPFLGTIAGLIGAVYGWHWSFASAILLFFWPFILPLVFAALRRLLNPPPPPTFHAPRRGPPPPSGDVIDV